MAEQLEGEALFDFLCAGHRTAKIACVKKDGSPIVSPVWFIVDHQQLVFTTMNNSLKYKLMTRDPRVSVCVENDQYPYGFATLQGSVHIKKLPVEELLHWTTLIAERYVPDDLAAEYGKRNAVEEEVLVRMTIEKSLAFEGIAN